MTRDRGRRGEDDGTGRGRRGEEAGAGRRGAARGPRPSVRRRRRRSGARRRQHEEEAGTSKFRQPYGVSHTC
ncbi:hypothetical protein GQ55_9G259000 [Panicum hallii var. hallii]|uniref:Uncharacterized protein n=1 Tax=Panicum hallii var. hallii TaxID=1504633 RepID=A0A2T7C7B7_9POAL|nr:hypothetical protein GQ55_9G259000 [Panicum hallii var. hallii]